MAFGNNPGLWGESVRKALNPDEERAAREHATGVEQDMIDTAELQEVERSGSLGATTPTRPPSGLQGIVDRLFRRSR